MKFKCQTEALESLKLLAEHNQHGVIITGDSGSGKTYLAKQYAKMLSIPDFLIVNPVMSDLKSVISGCVTNGTSVVLCIENLDSGVIQVAYPLLKLIEDCPKFIYVVVTCNNLYAVPDTIASRCALVTINPPTNADILQYAQTQNPSAICYTHKVWTCIRSFGDADIALKFTPEQLQYFDSLPGIVTGKGAVSNIAWKIQHYDDNSESPITIVIRYLLKELGESNQRACIDCLNDLASNRISKNAVVSRLVFVLKYTK